ncbi:hypothetical protein PGT21_030707 [Puccinia graminis f. sp. tritici]|uniref:Tet-like 2OG-Fe(II) oxygenase domain-containing protein n=3 Tax=Puccinia graminis f. sp. tritici TaxID=56615 RepID=A0A5B0R567_PUCGR|nr:hypothetical protein PGTUg99_050278 [Puccinia graminis f. sp. tritici]KAA1100160.1 hypothetical protein PGT21_030707 [Puccinia graminis f. sp. tritici]KAA1120667.1 hypothetical protein PGTUg99_050079 [Puccinia graminis f. sp. tritici]KAA1121083.1 hypothetical protein PGTUg99_050270 [Puccinia graminis f. sp. tritici]KAA1133268.1 hypothetical protein PGTUg99_050195 [Puccinia graminis f. sp. tritici]
MARNSHRHVNRASKLANTRNKAKKRAELHAWIQERVLNLSMGLFNSIRWQRLTWYPDTLLYPTVPFDKATDKPTRHPTPDEVQKACKFADRNFYLMNAGRPVLLDPRNPESVIAIMDFTPWDRLTETDKANLEFVSTFLHQTKEFVNPVSSSTRSWGGKMWGIGWRKSQDFLQIFGRYIKQFPPNKMEKYDTLFQKSKRVGEILGEYYKNLASGAFKNNQDLMKLFNLPSFDSLSFGEKPSPNSCSPHLTFTTNNFFNPPHKDHNDMSKWAFVMFIPIYSATGKLAGPDSGYDLKGGPFVFPSFHTGISFDKQHGIVRMIWQANKYRHCTLPYLSPSGSTEFTRLGLSLQITTSIVDAVKREAAGYYTDPLNYFGDHFYYMFRCLAKGTLLAALFCFHYFLFIFS